MNEDSKLIAKLKLLRTVQDVDRHRLIADLVNEQEGAALVDLVGLHAYPDLDADAAIYLASHYAPRRVDGEAWFAELSDVFMRAELSPQRLLRIVSDVCWRLRTVGRHISSEVAIQDLSRIPAGTHHSLVAYFMFCQSARFNFDFKLISRALAILPSSTKGLMPSYFRALACFVRFGQGNYAGTPEIAALANAENDPKVLHILGHALWFSPNQADAELLLTITEKLVGLDETDFVAWYRKATALRRLDRFDDALEALTAGIGSCPKAESSVGEDLIREHQMIVLQADIVGRVRQTRLEAADALELTVNRAQEEMRAAMERELHEIGSATSDALFKVVEILGLFTAIIAVIATGFVGGMTGTQVWWQRLVIVMAGAIGSLVFFVLLRIVVRPRVREGKFKEGVNTR